MPSTFLHTAPAPPPRESASKEPYYPPDEGYSTPPENLAAGSPQSFTSEGSSSQHAEASPAGAGRGDRGSLGGSYQAEHQPLRQEKDQTIAGGEAAQPEEAAARPALTRCACISGNACNSKTILSLCSQSSALTLILCLQLCQA